MAMGDAVAALLLSLTLLVEVQMDTFFFRRGGHSSVASSGWRIIRRGRQFATGSAAPLLSRAEFFVGELPGDIDGYTRLCSTGVSVGLHHDLCKVRNCARTSMGTPVHMSSPGLNPKSFVHAMPCPYLRLA